MAAEHDGALALSVHRRILVIYFICATLILIFKQAFSLEAVLMVTSQINLQRHYLHLCDFLPPQT